MPYLQLRLLYLTQLIEILAKKYLFPRQIRCKRCGATNIFTETEMGHVVVTDPEHAARFTTKEEVKDGTEGQG